jgi:hypothetical protein
MNYKELIDETYTGGNHIFGFVLMDDIRKYDSVSGVERYEIVGYPTDYMVRCSDVMSVYVRSNDSKQSWVTQHQLDGLKNGSMTLGSVSCSNELPDDVGFGYSIKAIDAALSVFLAMDISIRNVAFHFPDIDAPLILSISNASVHRSGPEWGILICSCDIIEEVFI